MENIDKQFKFTPIPPTHVGHRAASSTVQEQRSLMSRLFTRAGHKGEVQTKRLFLEAIPRSQTRRRCSVQYFNSAELAITWSALRPLLDRIPGAWHAMYENNEDQLVVVRGKIHDLLCSQRERLEKKLLPVFEDSCDLSSVPLPEALTTHTKQRESLKRRRKAVVADDDTETDSEDWTHSDDEVPLDCDSDSDGEFLPRQRKLPRISSPNMGLKHHRRSVGDALTEAEQGSPSSMSPPRASFPLGWNTLVASEESSTQTYDDIFGSGFCLDALPRDDVLVDVMRGDDVDCGLPSASIWADSMGTRSHRSTVIPMATPTRWHRTSTVAVSPATVGQHCSGAYR